MIKILLICNQGTSVSMLPKKIEDYAKGKGVDVHADAASFVNVENYVDQTDIMLIGPQARYLLKKMQNEYGDKVPVIQVINMLDFGLLKADKIFDEAYAAYSAR